MSKFILFISISIFLFSNNYCKAQSFSLDTTFGISGKRGTYTDCNTSFLLPDNKLLVTAGLSANFGILTPTIGIRKYNANGSVDSTFGAAGVALFTSPDVNDRYTVFSMTVQPDGKIIVGGRTHKIGGFVYYYEFFLLRFNANGTIDESFGKKGLVVKAVNFGYNLRELFEDISMDKKGRIVAVGYTEDDINGKQDAVAMRFLQNGTIDSTFATNGVLKLNLADSDNFSNVKTLVDNSILIAGVSTTTSPNQVMLVVKLDENGRFDASFGINGMTSIEFDAGRKSVAGIFLKPNNKIMIVGSSAINITERIAFAQLTSNGQLDSTFSGDGKNLVVATVINHYTPAANQVSLLPDNKFLVFSTTKRNDNSSNNYDFVVVRINEDATLDRTFANSGVFLYETTAESEYAYGLHAQNDGKVLLLVYSWDVNVAYSGNIYRYKNAYTPTTNVSNNDPDVEIEVYPNPVTDQLTIQCHKLIEKAEIYSLEGRKIQSLKAPFNNVDVSGLNVGIYFLSIYFDNQVYVKKILKQ